MIKLALLIFDLFAPVFRLVGVDYGKFRTILRIKLAMDFRRGASAVTQNKKKKPVSGFRKTLFVYSFMGVFVGLMIMGAGSPLVGLTMVHAMLMVMVGMALVADFSSVLLDTRDNFIILPRPVDGRTFLAARVAHITTYLFLLSMSLSFFSFALGTAKFGLLFVPAFFLSLMCTIGFTVFVGHIFYLGAMRLMSVERFRDVIMYFQIILTLLVFGGYQIMPRIMDVKALQTYTFPDRWWVYLLPPCWSAGIVELFVGDGGGRAQLLSLVAIIVPALCVLLVVRFLAPGFSEAMGRFGQEDQPASLVRNGSRVKTGIFVACLAKIISRRPQQRAVFELVWHLCARDRQFKLRMYTLFAFVPIIGVVMISNSMVAQEGGFAALRESRNYLFLLYIVCLMAPASITHLKYSQQHLAAWIYRALPLIRPGDALAAGIKVLTIQLYMPMFAVVAAIAMGIWGLKIVPDLLLAYGLTMIIIAVQALWLGRSFPFSEEISVAEGSGRAGKSFAMMLICGIFGGAHLALLTFLPPVIGWCTVLVGAVIAFGIARLLFNIYADSGWGHFPPPDMPEHVKRYDLIARPVTPRTSAT